MKSSLLILNLMLFPAAALLAQTPTAADAADAADAAANVRENVTPEVRKDVLAAVEQWRQAALQKNRSELQRLLHDDLSYGHTTGEVLNKAQTIERGLAAQQSFSAIDLADQTVRAYGNFALVTQTIAFHVSKDGAQSVANLSGIDVWIKERHGWQLLARQLTRLPQSAGQNLLGEAAAIQKHIVTFDNHLDVPFEYGTAGLAAGIDGPTQFDLPKAERGLVKGVSIAIFVPQGARTAEGTRQARALAQRKFEIITGIATQYPDRAAIAYSPADLRRIEESGKLAIVLSILNGNAIGDDLSQLDAWYQKGVRIIGFSHAGNNDLADSSRPNLLRGDKLDEHGGLSALGKQAVARLNDLGTVIDVSQLSRNALAQVLELTRAPVVASHSNARAIIDHPRNLSDEQLSAIKKNGGVVAVNAYSSWVRPLPADAQRKANDIRREFGVPTEANIAASQPLTAAGVKILSPEKFDAYNEKIHKIILDPAVKATVAQYVDQIDHVVKTIGIDHVGISSDFNHGGGVIGWDNEGEALNVTAELLRRGYTQQDIGKLWGGNFLRVWEAVQALAKK